MTALHLCRVRARQKQKKAHSRERPTVHCCCKSLLRVPFTLRPHSLYYSTSVCVRRTAIYAFVFNVPFHICHSLFVKNLKIRRQHHFSPFEYLFYFKKPGRTPPRTWRPSNSSRGDTAISGDAVMTNPVAGPARSESPRGFYDFSIDSLRCSTEKL